MRTGAAMQETKLGVLFALAMGGSELEGLCPKTSKDKKKCHPKLDGSMGKNINSVLELCN